MNEGVPEMKEEKVETIINIWRIKQSVGTDMSQVYLCYNPAGQRLKSTTVTWFIISNNRVTRESDFHSVNCTDFRVGVVGMYTLVKPLSANPTKCSNTLKQFVGWSRRIIWVRLTIFGNWRLKGYCQGITKSSTNFAEWHYLVFNLTLTL